MRHVAGIMLICSALGACASSSSLPSLSSIGGPGDDKPAKESAPKETASASSGSGGNGGIWSNFSSIFNSGAQPVSQKAEIAPPLDTTEALRLVNEYRAQKKLKPVALDPQATAAAQVLARDMAQHDHMSHIGPDGQDVGQRLINAGYSYRLAAENVGVGQATLQETIENWKKSPPHSRNLLLPGAKHIGIAYDYKPGTNYKTFWALVVAAP